MNYTYVDDKIFFDKKPIYHAQGNIRKILVDDFNHNAYIAYDATDYLPEGTYPIDFPPTVERPDIQEIINCNVVCISSTGDIVWRIQKTSDRPLQHISIFNLSGNLWAKRWDNYEFKVDKNTGKILDKVLGI